MTHNKQIDNTSAPADSNFSQSHNWTQYKMPIELLSALPESLVIQLISPKLTFLDFLTLHKSFQSQLNSRLSHYVYSRLVDLAKELSFVDLWQNVATVTF